VICVLCDKSYTPDKQAGSDGYYCSPLCRVLGGYGDMIITGRSQRECTACGRVDATRFTVAGRGPILCYPCLRNTFHSCWRKERYKSRGETLRETALRYGGSPGNRNAYPCPICGGWHATRRDNASPNAVAHRRIGAVYRVLGSDSRFPFGNDPIYLPHRGDRPEAPPAESEYVGTLR
jgi:hypothetical protein